MVEILKNSVMHTKFKIREYRKLSDAHWQHLLNISGKFTETKTRTDFMKFMQTKFGNPKTRWSIRWGYDTVDVRFHDSKDLFEFKMFYTTN